MERVCLGIDIGGTNVKYGLVDRTGKVLQKGSCPTDLRGGGSQVLAAAIEAVRKDCGLEGVSAIGIAVPGPVTGASIVHGCPNLGWGETDVRAEAVGLTGRRVTVLNDADAAALAELRLGSGQGRENMLFVTVGTGIGSGLILGGRLVEGAFGAGGEIGHMPMTDDPAYRCGCGKNGCLERYASGTSMVREWLRLLPEEDPRRAAPAETIGAREVFAAAEAGDPAAAEAIGQAAEMLGTALAFAACVADPGLFVIGGGVAAAGETYLAAIEKAFRRRCYAPSRETAFRLASLGGDAGFLGAALAAAGADPADA